MARKIKLFLIVQVRSEITPNVDSALLSVSPTLAGAQEYIVRHICFEYNAHFIGWCSLHGNLDPKLFSSQQQYVVTCHPTLPQINYTVYKGRYDKQYLATFVRLANNCLPLAASYEFVEESEHYLAILKANKVNSVDQNNTGE